MKIMLFLILISLLLAAGFLLAYLRAARDGQFDDEYTPSIRMLFDSTVCDDLAEEKKKIPAPSRKGAEQEIKQQDDDLPTLIS